MVQDRRATVDRAERIEELEARAHQLEQAGDRDAARQAFDDALKIEPSSQSCAEGRARVAIQLREPGAAKHCARALAFRDNDPNLQFQMITVAATELCGDAIPLLETFLAAHPQAIEAHELLAELRAQAGAGDAFADEYLAALQRTPDNKALLKSYWSILSRSGRHLQALESIDSSRQLFAGDQSFALLEIAVASHAGLLDRAGDLLEKLDDSPEAQLARGQHQLQTGRADEAAKLLEQVVATQPANLTAWALLEPSWRLTGDKRHDWLVGQPGLYGTSELELDPEELASIAAALRTLHHSRAQPLGQSVRGGTQTGGNLFMRGVPEIGRLAEAIALAVRRFVSALPPTDPAHPMLRYRGTGLAFGPSWSVRLTEGGFHSAHFHPGGVLSSACYVSLPAGSTGPDQGGWLEIGRPPEELMLDLPPLATFEPKPGRLVLFPSFLFHGTRPFTGGERLTVAFDLTAAGLRDD